MIAQSTCFDFHSTLLNRQLDDNEEVFMEQPPGYEESDPKKYCVKLYKPIYSFKRTKTAPPPRLKYV
jgi:hypothetical protein